MKMIAEYLEHALQFEQMAAETSDAELKTNFLNQAAAYHKLAEIRAEKLRVSLPRLRRKNSN
jgi:hypothetical protein